MKYFSLFTGIGGFELGIQQAYDSLHRGHPADDEGGSAETVRGDMSDPQRLDVERPIQCVGYSEIDKYAIQIYERHFGENGDYRPDLRNRVETLQENLPDPSERENRITSKPHKNYGDITQINADTLPDFDLLCGGFPCQAFSVAGKRRGFDDTRGTLFFDICRLAKAKRPRLLLLENVKGLLNHDGGQTFRVILSSLDELGYDCQWQVCNSKDFGVPQNRERVIIVGHLRGTPRPEVFPLGEGNAGDSQGKPDDSKTSRTVSARFAKGVGNTESRIIDVLVNAAQAQRIRSIEGLAQTLSGLGGGQGAKTGLYNMSDMQIRRLTPTECERLQGFPDGWTAGVSDTQRYKTLGNAVTVNVIQAVAERLLTTGR